MQRLDQTFLWTTTGRQCSIWVAKEVDRAEQSTSATHLVPDTAFGESGQSTKKIATARHRTIAGPAGYDRATLSQSARACDSNLGGRLATAGGVAVSASTVEDAAHPGVGLV